MQRPGLYLKILFCCWYVTACAGGTMQLTSIPEGSNVQLISNRGEIKALGKTPLNMPTDQMFINAANFANLRVEKDGYFSQSFIIPRSSIPNNHEISVSLEQKPEVKTEPAPAQTMTQTPPTPIAVEMDRCSQLSKESLTKLSKGVAVVQSIILKREFEIAKVRLSGLIADFPYISVLYDLQGNIFYLQKNYNEAVLAYEKSLELEPDNMETAFIVKKLRVQLGRNQ